MHFTPDMLPVKGRRFEQSQQAIVFSKNVSRWCAVALALICVQLDISIHFLILFAVQSMAPHAGRATQGKGDHHGFYGGDAVLTFPSIVKQSSLKKSAWSWEWHTFFIFFLCSCCCWRTAIQYLTVCETLWSQNALFMYMARIIIVPYQPGSVVATPLKRDISQSPSIHHECIAWTTQGIPRQLATCTLMKGRERRVKTTNFQLLTSVHSLSFGFLGPFRGCFCIAFAELQGNKITSNNSSDKKDLHAQKSNQT